MKSTTSQKIEKLLINVINKKIKNYESETDYRPFIEALIEKKLITIGSKIHSMNTSLGMSIYEQIAIILGTEEAGYIVKKQYKLEGCIDDNTELLIKTFCFDSHTPNKKQEIEIIRKNVIKGTAKKHKQGTVDVFIKKPNGEEVYIDIASGKMNKKEFESLRAKMLRWCALRLSQDSTVNIKTCIGIPFNPYYPEPYQRWTSNDCDVKEELLIQENLWKEFSGGEDVFEELIEIFKKVGNNESLKKEISNFLN